MKKKALTLIGEALRVGDTGKCGQTAAQEIHMGWPRPPVVKKLTTGPLRGFCQSEAVHIVLSNLSAEAP